jgi:DNA-binding beta-propeller fold protein YncE
LGTFSVGNAPLFLAFDGANIWVSNFHDATVTELRASDGSSLGTFKVGKAPVGVAFDGVHIWVANESGGTLSKL